jgi:hypothetical protein
VPHVQSHAELVLLDYHAVQQLVELLVLPDKHGPIPQV